MTTNSEGKSWKWQHNRLQNFIWDNPMQKGIIFLLILSTKRFRGSWCFCFVCTLLIFVCMLSIFETCIYGIRGSFFNTRMPFHFFSYVLHPRCLFAIEASDILRWWLFHIILSWGRKWYHYRIWKPKIFCWLPCTADEAFLQRSLSFSATR